MKPFFPPVPDRPIFLPPAFVVSVPTAYFVRHYGIVSDERVGLAPTIISLPNASSGAREETWTDFAHGDPIRVDGYPGTLPPEEVLRRARSSFGLPWTVSFNCEHFVTWCHGVPPRSPQLENWIAVSGLGLLFAKLWK